MVIFHIFFDYFTYYFAKHNNLNIFKYVSECAFTQTFLYSVHTSEVVVIFFQI